ncbi:putative multi-domain containing protein [Aduncisulcus paluster]|uniref:60S acidic ribosomal protein P0 n=1 Tax=Aduncisulcus paluster TaxID=2918883 RepID=A0ABQ5KRY9_9EUKA|nr:putative multi-domain containing protein [Aduncisulcus paluster]|eukprot:gnl/Carplike_NY0171/35_a50_8349.p1 GENE.gnl/Carplike_NY0171/35_a50_8349~~gnl/Carplike_NY0171/35_a50_8349.p1  ORF type:complete len:310 (-),score=141.21 gnl/Carplike_NY0171/35_a50_8349:99-1028(-)
MPLKPEKKKAYFEKLENAFHQYSKILIVGVDNVGSKQMQDIRFTLRGKAEVILGKNSLMRFVLRKIVKEIPALGQLNKYLKGNVGFVFTDEDPAEIREILTSFRRKAPAKAGTIAPCDVVVEPMSTGLAPNQVGVLQVLDIPVKVARGAVEITEAVKIITKGDIVGPSEANLLSMIKIEPFFYGLEVCMIYDDGEMYSPDVLDLTDEDYLRAVKTAVTNMTALALGGHIPSELAAPHIFREVFRNILSVVAETEITFPAVAELKEYLADPSKFVVAAPVEEEKAEEKAADAEEEEEEESSSEGGFGGLF